MPFTTPGSLRSIRKQALKLNRGEGFTSTPDGLDARAGYPAMSTMPPIRHYEPNVKTGAFGSQAQNNQISSPFKLGGK